MQPQEPVPGPMAPPPDEGTPPDAPAKKSRNRRLRLWVALGAGVLALLCLGGAGVALLLYDGETKIERADPDAVADNFLRAYLVNRDDQEAALNICKSGARLTEIEALRNEMVEREKNFDVKVSASWSSLTVADESDGRKSVDADLTITGSSNGSPVSRRTEAWSFGLVDEDGWRVCSAVKTA
ncbi:MAG TPA: hypothetical protein VFG35_12865 [Actinoplanes sp.]|nr:hypothetical protein [Actinoplanes sp.]